MADDTDLTPQVEHERIAPETGSGSIEGDWPPYWMVTYSDMVTNLMTFFVLWYALTTAGIDPRIIKIRTDDSVIIRGIAEKTNLDRVTEEELRILRQFQRLSRDQQRIVLAEMRALRIKAEEVMEFIRQGRMENEVEMKVTAEDIVIIPTAPLVFREGSADIRESFYPVLDKIAWLLKETGASVRIEGHTDATPIHPRHRQRFPTNWDLSAARAISVARYLLDAGEIPPERIAAAAYGPSRPKFSNDDPDLMPRNRRVEFHIFISSESISKK
ncbi:MAG: flagellar motor protein MotB [PVC group bacterium]